MGDPSRGVRLWYRGYGDPVTNPPSPRPSSPLTDPQEPTPGPMYLLLFSGALLVLLVPIAVFGLLTAESR